MDALSHGEAHVPHFCSSFPDAVFHHSHIAGGYCDSNQLSSDCETAFIRWRSWRRDDHGCNGVFLVWVRQIPLVEKSILVLHDVASTAGALSLLPHRVLALKRA